MSTYDFGRMNNGGPTNIVCPSCGNNKRFESVQNNGSTINATCDDCGRIFKQDNPSGGLSIGDR